MRCPRRLRVWLLRLRQPRRPRPAAQRYVQAVVSCWGGVVAGTLGFRAQHARIDALWLHPNVPRWVRQRVAARYPSPGSITDRDAMLAEHPLTHLAATSRRRAAAAAARAVLARRAGAARLGLVPAALVLPALHVLWFACRRSHRRWCGVAVRARAQHGSSGRRAARRCGGARVAARARVRAGRLAAALAAAARRDRGYRRVPGHRCGRVLPGRPHPARTGVLRRPGLTGAASYYRLMTSSARPSARTRTGSTRQRRRRDHPHRAARRPAGSSPRPCPACAASASACGCRSARGTRRRRWPAPATSSSTCCSRARQRGRRWTSRARWTPSAASSTRSPRRSTPASTPPCSTATCRWPSTSSADVVLNATLTAQDVDVERSVVLEEIAMRDDDPSDLVHDEFSTGAVRRHAARPADPRHRRVDHRAEPDADRTATTAAATTPARWSSRSPATSTTGDVVRLVRARVRRPARRRPRRSRRSARGAGTGVRPRPVRVVADDTEQANIVLGMHGVPGTTRAASRGRAVRRVGRRHESAAVPAHPRGARPGLLGVLVHAAASPTSGRSACTPVASPARPTRCSA